MSVRRLYGKHAPEHWRTPKYIDGSMGGAELSYGGDPPSSAPVSKASFIRMTGGQGGKSCACVPGLDHRSQFSEIFWSIIHKSGVDNLPWGLVAGGSALTSGPRPAKDRSRRKATVADRGLGRLNWAESAPTRVTSGRTGVRAKASIPLRARKKALPPEVDLRAQIG